MTASTPLAPTRQAHLLASGPRCGRGRLRAPVARWAPLLLALLSWPGWAHEDHVADTDPAPLAAVPALPRAYSASAQFELVADLPPAGGGLRVYLDDYATNAPVEDATLALQLADISARARPGRLPGEYRFVQPAVLQALKAPGEQLLRFTVQTPTRTERLSAYMTVAAGVSPHGGQSAQAPAGEDHHDHGGDDGHGHEADGGHGHGDDHGHSHDGEGNHDHDGEGGHSRDADGDHGHGDDHGHSHDGEDHHDHDGDDGHSHEADGHREQGDESGQRHAGEQRPGDLAAARLAGVPAFWPPASPWVERAQGFGAGVLLGLLSVSLLRRRQGRPAQGGPTP